MLFGWAVTYCNFSFLLKLDDDVFVHIPRVLSFLSAPNTPKKKLYAGNHYTNNVPFKGGKWRVTYEEYNETIFGFLPRLWIYFTSRRCKSICRNVLLCSALSTGRCLPGVLSNRNGVSDTNNYRFEVWNPPGLGGECQMKIETFVTSWLIIVNMR